MLFEPVPILVCVLHHRRRPVVEEKHKETNQAKAKFVAEALQRPKV
jgi:hypothetical protein